MYATHAKRAAIKPEDMKLAAAKGSGLNGMKTPVVLYGFNEPDVYLVTTLTIHETWDHSSNPASA